MNEEQNIKQLPKDWKWEKLGEVCEFSQGIQVDIHKQSQEKNNGLVRFLRIIDFTQNDEPPRYIDYPGDRYFLKKDDIAMVRYGTVGFVCTGKEGVIANNLFKIIPNQSLDKKYLINFLNSHLFKGKLKTKGATMQALSFGMINPIQVPVPPFKTQLAIVSKIEELFSELDKGIENLRLAQQQLKTYRQAVLKWAFEGKLTNENIKDGELPEGWKIVMLGEISEITSSRRIFQDEYVKEGVPFFRTKEIKELSEGKEISVELFITKEKYNDIKSKNEIPKIGDILLSAVGTIGVSYIIKDDKPFYFKDGNLVWIRKLKGLESKYLNFIFSHFIRFKQEIATSGSAYNALTIIKLKSFEIPLPSIEEQNKIVQEIESRLSVTDKMEESISQSLQQSEALRQSILKKAFEGRLI